MPQADKVFIKLFNPSLRLSIEKQVKVEQKILLHDLSPAILEFNGEQGYLIYEYINSTTLFASKQSIENKLSIASSLIFQTHQLDINTSVLDFVKIVGDLIDSSSIQEKYHQPLMVRVEHIVANLHPLATRRVFSHGDVNFHNILLNNSNAYLIDWECCGLAEPEFDLGMCLSINALNNSHLEWLIAQYQAKSQKLASVKSFKSLNIKSEKVLKYLEISNIINGLWFSGINSPIIEPDHQLLQNHFTGVLKNILLSL